MILLLFAVYGCAGAYGRLKPSVEVTRTFKAYEILPDHDYYYCGPEGRPDAIIAVQADFTLVSDRWVLLEPNSRQLRQVMEHAETYFRMNTHNSPSGYTILAPDGRRIGVWYSIWAQTTIEMLGGHEVRIYPPRTKDIVIDNDDEDQDGIP